MPEIPTQTESRAHNAAHWIHRWAERRPSAPAIADAERRLDYRGLEDRIGRLAGALCDRGVGVGDRVAILLGNRSAYLEAVFACARIGAISMPVNNRLGPAELAVLFEDAEPSVVLAEHSLVEGLQAAIAESRWKPPCTIEVGGPGDAYEALLSAARQAPLVAALVPEAPMMLMYTSGTTGRPKGALLPHRKTLFNCLNAEIYFGLGSKDRVLVAAPLFHSLGLQILALPALYAGASLVLHERFDPAHVWETVEREAITYFGGVPTMHERLLAERRRGRSAGEKAHSLDSLRFVFTAGSTAPVELIRDFETEGLVLKQGYGQTETSILTCLESDEAISHAGSVGRPVTHVELKIVDAEGFDAPPSGWRECAPGEVGEIVARGPITMLGYWRNPEATNETIREGWLRTGDLARQDADGYVTLVGRSKDMYISGGENVYPAEIEAVLCAHPAIAEAAVVGIPDGEWGEVGEAHVVPRTLPFDEPAVRAFVSERLARFKRPTRYVVEEELPRTASGKIRKALLTSGDRSQPGS